MNFGGLQKASLIDYPEKVSCVLFFSGCNFECPYCHNPQLAKGCIKVAPFRNGEGIYGFLERRRTFLDGVVISGGEPTLDKDLVTLCEKIKRMGYPIKLDTNGSRPDIIEKLIHEDLVDYIAMDVKTDLFHYAPFIQKDPDPALILRSIEAVMTSAPDYEFRTTCVRPFVDEKSIESIARTIGGAKLYVLQPFRPGEVLHPEFFRGQETVYDKDQMTVLQSIAAPWVEACIVR
jgi:pyruvate formate lyase activating enzyme